MHGQPGESREGRHRHGYVYPLFQGRVVKDSERKKGESLLASTPVVVLSAILGRTPNLDEYLGAVEGIPLTKFAPPLKKMSSNAGPGHLLSY